MKPFNLEQALAGKPVIRRDGVKIVQVVHLPAARSDYMKVIVVTENGSLSFYATHGVSNGEPKSCFMEQLLMAPETVTVWLNVYRGSASHELSPGPNFYENEAEAKQHSLNQNFIKTIPITFEL